MKGFIVLLCALVAVQARSTAVSKSPVRAAAALGDNPWLVHLRIAVDTSGLLNTCAGSLISSSWSLTAASCLTGSRYIWIRYGAINVLNPSLVTENSIVRNDPQNILALISINRYVQSTDYISPVSISTSNEAVASATFCSFNVAGSDAPGEFLNCYELDVESNEDSLTSTFETTEFDLGAPLVKDGVQIGLLASSADGVTTFIRPGAFLEWIEAETGEDFGSVADAVVAAEDGTKVIVVN